MTKPELDDFLEQLEDAREAGRALTVEDVCADHPEMIDQVRTQWQKLLEFERKFGTGRHGSGRHGTGPQGTGRNGTRRETTDEVERKLAAMPESMAGKRLVMQTELNLDQFHDRGGLGDVYVATDAEHAREVAVKLLRTDRQGTVNQEDFKRERQIIGGLVHPGIVSIQGSGETIDGRPFYTMPFLGGGNLRSGVADYHRQNRNRIQESDTQFRDLIYRLSSVCKTIAYAHSRGIVHRDLKAENVLLGKYGETQVIDWGCATRVDRGERFRVTGEPTLQLPEQNQSTSSGGLTLRYASPEQIHGGKPVGPESDIYSLGAVLYLILTGESPLEREPDEHVRRLVLAGEIADPATIKSGMSRRLVAVCHKAMSVDPEQRYATALEMADDLERFLADEPVSACPDTFGLRLVRIVRRNRTASMLLLGTLVIGSVLLSLAFAGQSLFARRAEASAEERLRMAATLAANVGGFEISRRISLLEKEAADPELVSILGQINSDPEDRQLWERVQNRIYEFRDELSAAGVDLESMFLTDASGVQVARAPKSASIGRKYAYRHYFHGLQEDLDPSSQEYLENPPPPATGPVISNAYVSTNKDESGQHPIKTAFTVPVLARGDDGATVVLGRLGMSVKVNDLAVFQRLSELSVDAVLIETRDYQWGSGRAPGLIMDRIQSDQTSVTVPTSQVTMRADPDSEISVKDSMLRLETETLLNLAGDQAASDEAVLITNFKDPVVSPVARDAAVAELKVPYRADLSTGWTVLFLESSQESR